MSKSVLNFQNLDRRRVHLLCRDKADGERVALELTETGYSVELSLSPQEFYQRVSVGKPGFAMISTAMDGEMAKLLPDFVTRRFGVPVILFKENEGSPEPKEFLPGPLNPEIQAADGVGLNAAIENFERKYSLSLGEGDACAPGEPPAAIAIGPGKSEPVDLSASGRKLTNHEAILRMIAERLNSKDVPLGLEDVLQVHSYKVPDPAGNGAFVFAFPFREGVSIEKALLTLESLIREKLGDQACADLSIEAVPASFFDGMKEGADRVLQGEIDGCEVLIAFYGHPVDPVLEKDSRLQNGAILVPVEEWWIRLPIPCHAYVWLEKNQKQILYIRPGERLREKSLNRFRERGFQYLSVSGQDYENFCKMRELARLIGHGPEALLG